jgi:hypothetical protein
MKVKIIALITQKHLLWANAFGEIYLKRLLLLCSKLVKIGK